MVGGSPARLLADALARVRGAFASVRVRVTVLATLLLAAAFFVAALALVGSLGHMLERSGDLAARARARDLAALAKVGALPRLIKGSGEEGAIQVVGPSGDVVSATHGLLSRPPIGGPAPSAHGAQVRTVPVRDNNEYEPYRVWVLRVDTSEGPFVVHVGSSLEEAHEAVATLRGLLLAWLPALTCLLAVGAWVVVGRALRPVEAIRAEVAHISGSALDRRVSVPATDDEIARLARTMNAMLERLEESSRRQRRFVADASHELQSPLTAVRADLEVGLSHPGRVAWPTLAADLLADTERMERLVRDLLFLAASDEGRPAVPGAEVDLDAVVFEEAARLRKSGPATLDVSGVSAVPVRGSSEELARLVRNLLENAQRHARSTVRVGLEAGNGSARLVVEDDGPGVPADLRERVFARFVQADSARPRDDGGTGLGLAIVREIAERHDGSVYVDDSASGGARFVVLMPAMTSDNRS